MKVLIGGIFANCIWHPYNIAQFCSATEDILSSYELVINRKDVLRSTSQSLKAVLMLRSNLNQWTRKPFPVSERTYLCEHADTVTSAFNV